jgi:hypothetical protein
LGSDTAIADMAENINQNLDLEKILATLANLPKPEAQPYQDQQQPYEPYQSHQGYQEAQKPYPSNQSDLYQQPADPRLAGRSALQHRHPPPKPQDRVSSPFIDPSTITEWKQGLRCVSNISSQNPDFAPAVRKVGYTSYDILYAALTYMSVDERPRVKHQVLGSWAQKPH